MVTYGFQKINFGNRSISQGLKLLTLLLRSHLYQRLMIYDEQGKDAMEWVEEVDPFHLETLTALRKYQQVQPSEQEWMRGELDETMNEVALRTKEEGNKKSGKSYKIYSLDQKVLFLYYFVSEVI